MPKTLDFEFVVRFARRIPDPVDGVGERHIFLCNVEHVPAGVPKDPNPRAQRIDRGIWRDIRKHLLNQLGTPNTFHLKNKGITLVASGVRKLSDEKYVLTFGPSDGILDGGHTYELVTDAQDEIREHNAADTANPIQQFVKIEVLSGVAHELLIELAGGLNTAMQVQQWSLENLKGSFDWITKELAKEPYYNLIAFRENEEGKHMDVRDIIVLLDLVNVAAFPNDKNEHPVRAYTSKSSVFDHYAEHVQQYELMRPILKDVLKLYDTICAEGPVLHNENGGKAGNLSFVESRASLYPFPFISTRQKKEQRKMRLVTAAAYPMVAAFRWCVDLHPKTGKAQWTMPFEEVLEVWRASGGELMKATQQANEANGYKANAIGRSGMHWSNLHNIVAKRTLMRGRNTA